MAFGGDSHSFYFLSSIVDMFLFDFSIGDSGTQIGPEINAPVCSSEVTGLTDPEFLDSRGRQRSKLRRIHRYSLYRPFT